LVEILIQSYFNIVKRTISDMIPKAIMLNLVTFAKENLQRELLTQLYNNVDLTDILQESDHTINRRKECKQTIEALQRADDIIGSSMG
jgi:dynamin 1-like protein